MIYPIKESNDADLQALRLEQFAAKQQWRIHNPDWRLTVDPLPQEPITVQVKPTLWQRIRAWFRIPMPDATPEETQEERKSNDGE